MLFKEWAEYILEVFFPPIMLVFGIVGNIFVVTILSGKKFKNVSSLNYLRILAVNDALAIFTIIIYHGQSINLNILYVSQLSCQLNAFVAYNSPAVSSWILVYISIERMLYVKANTNLMQLFKKKTFQAGMLLIILIWNGVIYASRAYYTVLVDESANE